MNKFWRLVSEDFIKIQNFTISCWLPLKKDSFFKGFQQIAKFKAGRIINIIPAKTGSANKSKTAVTNIAQPNKGTLCKTCPGILIFITVVMTFSN